MSDLEFFRIMYGVIQSTADLYNREKKPVKYIKNTH